MYKRQAVHNAGAQIITLALRRANEGGMANILDYIPKGVTLLPNTSGARNADEAVRIARLSREVGDVYKRQPRIWQAVEPYPNRWTHHVLVSDESQLDGELLGWVKEAAAFAAVK